MDCFYGPQFIYCVVCLCVADGGVCVASGPINREMRNLISSLKNHNEQLKVEVQRYKRRLREAGAEITKVLNCRIAGELARELIDSLLQDLLSKHC